MILSNPQKTSINETVEYKTTMMQMMAVKDVKINLIVGDSLKEDAR